MSLRHAPSRTASYRFVHPGSADYASSQSTTRTVGVRTRVTAQLSSNIVNRGDRAVLRGAVFPNHRRQRVVLQRYSGGAWRKAATTMLTKDSRYRFRLPTTVSRRFAYRVVKRGHTDHFAGISPKRVLTVR